MKDDVKIRFHDELLKQLYKKYISLKKILYLFESIIQTMIHV